MKQEPRHYEALPEFQDAVPLYFVDEVDYWIFHEELLAHPEQGDVIPNTGGARKIRYEDRRRGKGKRGGLRIIYFWFSNRLTVVTVDIYSKDEKADLSADDRERIKRIGRKIRDEWKERGES
ncbi:MAG: toxin [Armatimonadetes bacterium]|nr:toxin [Armatimonadota bacterium]